MNKELLEAMEVLEKEKNISKDTLIEAIENSLLTACKNHFGKADNVKVTVNPNTCDFAVYAEKAVVENVEDDCLEMSLADAKMLNPKYEIGDTVQIPLDSKKFGRIATQNAKNVILQKIREEERKALYNEYYMKEKDVMTGVVQRYLGRNVSINLGREMFDQRFPEMPKVILLAPVCRPGWLIEMECMGTDVRFERLEL